MCSTNGEYALTYDDGPLAGPTDTLLSILDQNSLKATFFLIGSNIEVAGSLLAQEVAKGHETLSHTYTHPSLITLTPQAVYNEMYMTEQAFAKFTCRRPTLMRPPYGDINTGVRQVLHNMGYQAVIWSLDSLDWEFADTNPSAVLKWFQGNLTQLAPAGLFSLEHDLTASTVALAQSVIDMVSAMDYRFVSLEECLWGPNYYRHPSWARMYRLCTNADGAQWVAPTSQEPCPVSDWSEWSDCDTNCGTGSQTRVRLTLPPGQEKTTAACVGMELIQQRPCNTGVGCDATCVYGLWTAWSPCSNSCGGGTQIHTRAVISGGTCGPVIQTALCNTQGCSVPSVRLRRMEA